MLQQVLDNQAEEKVLNETRTLENKSVGSRSAGNQLNFRSTFPIDSLEDFKKLHNKLQSEAFATRVVSIKKI